MCTSTRCQARQIMYTKYIETLKHHPILHSEHTEYIKHVEIIKGRLILYRASRTSERESRTHRRWKIGK